MNTDRSDALNALQHWALLFGLASLWGTAFVFTRVAVEEIAPAALVTGRVLLAALALNLVRWAAGLQLPRDPALWLRFVPLAVTGTALPFLLVSWGQEGVASGLAGMLMAVTPLAAILLAHFAVPGERLTEGRLVGVFLGFLGVAVLLGPEDLLGLGARESLLRQLAVLAGAVCYAVNTILARRLPLVHPLVYASGVMIVGSLFCVPLTLASLDALLPAASTQALVSVVWLGLVPTGLATLVHYRLVVSAGAGFASLTNYIIPVIALAAGALVLGERTDPSALGGLALILLGIAVAGRRQSAPALPATHPPRSARGLAAEARASATRTSRLSRLDAETSHAA